MLCFLKYVIKIAKIALVYIEDWFRTVYHKIPKYNNDNVLYIKRCGCIYNLGVSPVFLFRFLKRGTYYVATAGFKLVGPPDSASKVSV